MTDFLLIRLLQDFIQSKVIGEIPHIRRWVLRLTRTSKGVVLGESSQKIYQRNEDDRISFILLTMQDEEADGIAADWHPSPKTHNKVSERVATAIKETLGI